MDVYAPMVFLGAWVVTKHRRDSIKTGWKEEPQSENPDHRWPQSLRWGLTWRFGCKRELWRSGRQLVTTTGSTAKSLALQHNLMQCQGQPCFQPCVLIVWERGSWGKIRRKDGFEMGWWITSKALLFCVVTSRSACRKGNPTLHIIRTLIPQAWHKEPWLQPLFAGRFCSTALRVALMKPSRPGPTSSTGLTLRFPHEIRVLGSCNAGLQRFLLQAESYGQICSIPTR